MHGGAENGKMGGVAKIGKKKLAYRRILLKLSGEVLRNRETGDSIDASRDFPSALPRALQ